MTIIRHKAKCNDCDYETHAYIVKTFPEKCAEDHAMQTGHIVDIKEVC